ncbi:MAG: nitrophenyl compound nitroreductase subunit ArsF family protein [Prolixibacteraceae bacterium]
MKQVLTIVSILFFLGTINAQAQCCANASKAESATKSSCDQTKADTSVKAYYFHATRRCATCQAVEEVTKEALKKYYGEKVSFESINNEEDAKNPMIAKYKISGQTLIIIKGDQVTNLTNEAFMYARTQPEKLKAKIKATIDPIL